MTNKRRQDELASRRNANERPGSSAKKTQKSIWVELTSNFSGFIWYVAENDAGISQVRADPEKVTAGCVYEARETRPGLWTVRPEDKVDFIEIPAEVPHNNGKLYAKSDDIPSNLVHRVGSRRLASRDFDVHTALKVWRFRNTEDELEYIVSLVKSEKDTDFSGQKILLSKSSYELLSKITNSPISEELTRIAGDYQRKQDEWEKSLEKAPGQWKKMTDGLEPSADQLAEWVAISRDLAIKKSELEEIERKLNSLRLASQARERDRKDPRARLRDLRLVSDEKEAILKAYSQMRTRLETSLPLIQLHIALKHAPFTVLTGPSGAGKTSLVHHYARALGMNVTTVAVQPNWTSVQDLHGYVDPVHRTSYRGTPFSTALETQVNYAAHNDGEAPLDLVLLDEINLSFVEYFLADYLSAFETSERAVQVATHDEVEGLSGEAYEWLRRGRGTVRVPRSFLIAGTANEDHTTRAFSDKFRDRSAFLLIPPPSIEQALQGEGDLPPQEFHVPRSAWESWQNGAAPTAAQRNVISGLAKNVTALGLPFSVRVFQRALKQYADAERLSRWFDLEQPEQRALDLALSLSVAPKYAQLLLGRTQEEQRKQLRTVLLGDRPAPLTTQVLEGLWPKLSS